MKPHDQPGELEGRELEALQREIERLRLVAAGDRGLLEALLQHSPHGVIVSDAAGKLVLHNRAAEQIWAGSASVGLEGWGEYRAFHRDGRPYGAGDWAMARCLSQGVVIAAEEVRIQRFDGSFGTILGSCAPIHQSDGTLQGALSVFADITNLVEARERLREAERRAHAETALLFRLSEASNRATHPEEVFEPALDAVTEALDVRRASILLFDPDGVMRFKAWRGLSPHYRAAVEGHSPWSPDAVHPEPIFVEDVELDSELSSYRPLFQSEGIRALAFVPLVHQQRLVGKFMVYSANPRVFSRHEVQLARTIATQVAQTISRAELLAAERSASRAVREADRRKEEFLAILAHELRNPLAPIVHAVEILRRKGPSDPALVRSREIIARQARHMSRMIDDLLDVSRISRGKLLLEEEVLDVAAVVRMAADDHADELARANVTLHLDVRQEPLTTVGDETRLAQVIGNLLQNAAKFTDGGGSVYLSVSEKEGRAVISVRDDGVGMTPEILQRIFEPFNQDERTLARTRGGLGLGLALVKGLVDLHGGTVTATSDGPDQGSEVTISLPLHARAAPATVAPDRRAAGDPLRVLVVEDNVDAAETLAMLLSVLGHEVSTVSDGESAVERARGLQPDLVLCDIGLPGALDGYGVARAFRADPAFDRLVLVALTGYGQAEDRARSLECGFDVHLTKPVSTKALEATLAQAKLRAP